VKKLLDLFARTVCIDTALEQAFALDYHMQSGGGGRTAVGDLVYRAKPYKKPAKDTHKQAAAELAEIFVDFITCHPSYARSDFVIPVPFFGQKSYDLPAFLARQICNRLQIPSGSHLVKKVQLTKSVKDLPFEEKFNAIRDAFQVVSDTSVQGKLITLIDDIYQSGATLHELARTLQQAGARVQGLAATKTARLSNYQD
jgi:predicted amidophosphoribosyltransferase